MRHILIGLSFFTLVACGSGGDTVSMSDGKGGTTTVKSDGTKATFTGEDGQETTINSGANQAQFSDFAPQYPGSKIKEAASIATEGSVSQTIILSSPDAPEKIRDFYKASLTKAGMSPNEISADGSFIVSAGKDKPSALISISREEDGDVVLGTSISMMVNTKE